MNLVARLELYKAFEKKRGRPLIVYVTSQRSGAIGSMAGDAIDEFIEQIEKLPTSCDSVDLLVESTGGDGLTAWRIMSLLRAKVKNVSVVVPHSAFSAATILALGGDEILMGRYGCLGPIDPQILVTNKDGTRKAFAYEDVVSFLEFVRKDAGLTEQNHVAEAFKMLCSTVEPPTLGLAKRASSQSVFIGEKLLRMHMTDGEGKTKASSIAGNLNKSYFNHGHALHRGQAQEIGLKIKVPDQQEEEIMWKIHKSFEVELNSRKPYNPISEFLSHKDASPYLISPPPLNIPSNVPQNVALQIITNHIQQQLSFVPPDVVKELKIAFVESLRSASECILRQKILLQRMPDLGFVAHAVVLDSGWRVVGLPTIYLITKEREAGSIKSEDRKVELKQQKTTSIT